MTDRASGGGTRAARCSDMKWLAAGGLLTLCSIAHADDRTFITLDAELGGGSVEVVGARHLAVTGDVGLTAGRWLGPDVGIGVRIASVLYGDTTRIDNHDVATQSDQVELVGFLRSPAAWFGDLSGRWVASAGVGGMRRRSDEIHCNGFGDDVECHTISHLERKSLVDASAFGGYQLAFHHVTLAVGARATVDTSGERHLGVGVAVGAAF